MYKRQAWDRCRRAGLSRDIAAPRRFCSETEISEERYRSPLTALSRPIRDALLRATSHDHVLILTDPQGAILSRHGTHRALAAAGRIGFQEGADWSESSVGTNAISEALRLGGPAYVSGEGHFAYRQAWWTCMASPIFSPSTGELLGVLDVSGPKAQLDRDVIGMVRMTALLAEEMLRLTNREWVPKDLLQLRLLGARPAARIGEGPWCKLSVRTAEILALLSSRPRGYSATELAYEIYGDGGNPVTIRAEMHRIRKRLGAVISSEPYRLTEGLRVSSDVARAEEALAHQDVDALLERYAQPLLPSSEAEQIVQWRAGLDQQANRLVEDYGSTAQRARWARTEMAWQPVQLPRNPESPSLSAVTTITDRRNQTKESP